MKRTKFFVVIIAVLGIAVAAHCQSRETVRGNHEVIKSERNTGSFTGIKVSSGVDVYLTQGDNEKVVVEADENLHEYIITRVKGDVLHVYTDANIRDAERERVYVTMKDISSAETTSAGDIVGETPVHADRLELSASSAGDIKLEIHVKDLRIDISSSGDMTLTGEAEKMDANLSSAGDLEASELETREADISVSSAGDADINVSERLTARASSAGDINYKGNPAYVDAHSSSAGGIHKR
jgi:hypothetical protein